MVEQPICAVLRRCILRGRALRGHVLRVHVLRVCILRVGQDDHTLAQPVGQIRASGRCRIQHRQRARFQRRHGTQIARAEQFQKRLRQESQRRMRRLQHRGQHMRTRGIYKISLFKQQRFTAPRETVTQIRVERQTQQRERNHPHRKIIEIRTVIARRTHRMLIIRLPQFIARASRQRRHKHAIVIKQTQLMIDDKQIAVLQIAVCDICAAQRFRQLQKLARDFEERSRIIQMLRNVHVEAIALDPIHFHNRKPLPAQTNALRQKRKFHRVRQRRFFEIRADGGITLRNVRHMPQETAHRVPSSLIVHLVHGCETARNRFGQSQRIADDKPVAQFNFRKCDARILHRVLIIRRTGPPHSSIPNQTHQGNIVVAHRVRGAFFRHPRGERIEIEKRIQFIPRLRARFLRAQKPRG